MVRGQLEEALSEPGALSHPRREGAIILIVVHVGIVNCQRVHGPGTVDRSRMHVAGAAAVWAF